MNYDNPELIDLLASEYVLGTLKGRARKRFERLMSTHEWIRTSVWRWEAQLMPMASAVEEVSPPEQVWENIQKGLGHKASDPKMGFWRQLNFWRGWSFLATASALVLVVVVFSLRAPVEQQEYVAIFNDDQSQPLWLISADLKTGEVFRWASSASNVLGIKTTKGLTYLSKLSSGESHPTYESDSLILLYPDACIVPGKPIRERS